jgi:hypothetical protein
MKHNSLILTLLIAVLFTAALPALAQYGLNETATAAGLKTGLASKSVGEIIGAVIQIALSFLGVVFMLLLLYAGYLWFTSLGDSKKTQQAKTLLTDAVIGLVIILSAYAISNTVITALVTAKK